MYKRIYYQQVISRLNEQRMHIQVLIGPRQVGKTTLIQFVQFANKFQPFRSLVIGADGLDCETFLRMDLRQLFA